MRILVPESRFKGIDPKTGKCMHGMKPSGGTITCAICKEWPSIDKMRTVFPGLSEDIFLVMTAAERIASLESGVLRGR